MISVIVCYHNADYLAELERNVARTIGCPYEWIAVDNMENQHSIFSAYNEGMRRSLHPYLCFVHEDVRFVTQDWGRKIVSHLQDPKVGLVGIAGGGVMPKIPSTWALAGQSYNLMQARRGSGGHHMELAKCPVDYTGNRRQVVIVDGVFLSMRRELSAKLSFDENFTGFHGYDYDLSAQSIVAGYKNYVVYDVLLEHFSAGNQNAVYYRQLLQVYAKWEPFLPLLADTVDYKKIDEVHNVHVMMRCMVAQHFGKEEIIRQVTTFKNRIGLRWSDKYVSLQILYYRIIVACSNLKWWLRAKISTQ